jgi:lysozyme family protein
MTLPESIVERILAREGGTSDHPSDDGGLTRFGITMPFLSDRLGHDAHPSDLLTITRDDAKRLYLAWLSATRLTDLLTIRNQDTSIPARVRLVDCICDWAVQRTPIKAVKLLQTLLGFHGADVDGIIGPQTVDAINAQLNDADLLTAYVKERVTHRARMVKSDASQVDFLLGWLNRDMSFL